MINAGDVHTRRVATVGKDASVVRAAAIMRQHRVHDLLVVECRGGKWTPAGIISDRDIAIEVVGQGLDPSHVTVATAMHSRQPGVRNGGGGGESTDSMDTMAMDEMLSLLVAELNRGGQPIRHNRLTQWTSLSAPGNSEH
jgi:signal-transduction protein with cAMP-binding, CBS, and nucleotidyltransferase domain